MNTVKELKRTLNETNNIKTSDTHSSNLSNKNKRFKSTKNRIKDLNHSVTEELRLKWRQSIQNLIEAEKSQFNELKQRFKVEKDDDSSNLMPNEESVGITEYVSENAITIEKQNSNIGFKCLIKERFQDFIVEEIDENGKLVQLNCTELPKEDLEEEERLEKLRKSDAGADFSEDFELKIDEQIKKFFENFEIENCFESDVKEKFRLFFVESDRSIDSNYFDIARSSKKDLRTKIHEKIRSYFDKLLISETINLENNEKIIRLRFKKALSSDKKRLHSTRSSQMTRKKEKYLHFVVKKTNLTSDELVLQFSRNFKRKPQHFGFAGTKDKRAVTVQKMSVLNISATRLLKFVEKNKPPGRNSKVEVGNFSYQSDRIFLGRLKGNRFTLKLLNIDVLQPNISTTHISSLLHDSVNLLKQYGFINYYGMQRFGVCNIPNHQIGREMLRGNWNRVVALILLGSKRHIAYENKGKSGDELSNKDLELRQWFSDLREKADLSESLRTSSYIVKDSQIRCLLEALIEKPNAFKAAFMRIPRKTRLFYIHSYQSQIQNKTVSYRIRTHGLKPIKDDYILSSSNLNNSQSKVASYSDKIKEKYDIQIFDKNESLQPSQNKNIIFDIAQPLISTVKQSSNPNTNTLNPSNTNNYDQNISENDSDVSKYCCNLLKEDGIEPNQFGKLADDKSMMLRSNDFRRIIVRPNNVTSLIEKNSLNASLPTILNKTMEQNGLNENLGAESENINLELSFELPSSSYATMALREFTRQPTSKQYLASKKHVQFS